MKVIAVVMLFAPLAWGDCLPDGCLTRLGPLFGSPLGERQPTRIEGPLPASTLLFRHVLPALTLQEREILLSPEPALMHSATIGVVRTLSGRPRLAGGTNPGPLQIEPVPRARTASFRSEGAGAIRLLVQGTLPMGARLYVRSAQGEVHGPYTQSHLRKGEFWTNTVFADEVLLEVRLPDGGPDADLTVPALLHVESSRASRGSRSDSECMLDVSCVAPADAAVAASASRAVAMLVWVANGRGNQCSGALLNNAAEDGKPYVLTAHHCASDAAAVETMEAIWQYRTVDCGGEWPLIQETPRSLGATLLATGRNDTALVLMNEPPPATAVFLGWDAEVDHAFENGTLLYRVSHPQGRPQQFSIHQVTDMYCKTGLRGPYIISAPVVGVTEGGSSGSSILLENLIVVGAASGVCALLESCEMEGRLNMDASFKTFYPYVAHLLGEPPREPLLPAPSRKRRAVRH